MTVIAGVVVAMLHTLIPIPFADGAWTPHTAAGLLFVVGAVDSLFLFTMRRKP